MARASANSCSMQRWAGDEAAALWAAADNARAQAFYLRNGFEPTGEQEVVEDWEGILELRMLRKESPGVSRLMIRCTANKAAGELTHVFVNGQGPQTGSSS